MAASNKLTAIEVKNSAPGKLNDGAGLWINKRADGTASWFMRLTVHGRRREMGLGAFPEVSIRQAREAAPNWREILRSGKDPIKERERRRREAAKEVHNLRSVAEAAFEARKAELKGDGKAGRWFSPLELHVLPKLGGVPVEDIDQKDVRDCIAPIWHTKAETARKAKECKRSLAPTFYPIVRPAMPCPIEIGAGVSRWRLRWSFSGITG